MKFKIVVLLSVAYVKGFHYIYLLVTFSMISLKKYFLIVLS